MKLKKWLKYIDPLVVIIIIFTNKSEKDVPAFEGYLWDIPKKYENMKIGRPKGDHEDPIFITHFTNKYGVVLDQITINLIEK